MADPLVLYVVTAIVVAGLAIWVVVVLLTADDAKMMAPMPAPAPPPAPPPLEPTEAEKREAKRSKKGPKRGKKRRKERAEEPKEEPEEDDGEDEEDADAADKPAGPAGPVIAEKAGSSPALVVALPTMRQRLDSHPEIEDGGAPESEPYQAPESVRPPGPALSLATAMGRTDPASRKQNEDAFAIIDRHHLFVVADGAGRASADVASQLAVDAIAATFDEDDPKASDVRGLSRRANRLRRAVLSAHRKILERAILTPASSGMGVSAVALHFSPDNHSVHVAHVGDARCYRVRGRGVALLTNHASASSASARLGAKESPEVQIAVESPEPGDLYVVCSDGLSRALTEAEVLASVTGQESLEDATTKLVDRAKAKGEREDITAILVRVEAPE